MSIIFFNERLRLQNAHVAFLFHCVFATIFLPLINYNVSRAHLLFHVSCYFLIPQRLESNASFAPSLRGSVGVMPSEEHTAIELTGTDRPGLLSEVCAVLTDLHCNVVNAEIWTHNTRAAAVVHVTDDSTGCAIKDPKRLSTIRELLCNVLKGNDDLKTATTTLSPPGVTSRERRLHQIMFADRDYERVERAGLARFEDKSSRPHVTVLNIERDYTVVSMRSKDRPKLLFDIVCTLTDMEYVVFHGMVSTGRMEAYQVR